MTIDTYAEWHTDGEPHRTAQPIADLAATLRRYGYTVYVLGDLRHLKATPPEDHTPYSKTGWPRANPYPWVHACDVMPPPAGSGLPSLRELGAQLFSDRQANVPGIAWLKYMNWEPSGSSGPCWHDKWTPSHMRTSSTDRGHLHLSARTDFTASNVAIGYDPVARVRGDDDVPTAQEIAKAVLDAEIFNPITGKPAKLSAYLTSVNRIVYESQQRETALATAIQQVLAEVSADPTIPVTIDDAAAEAIAGKVAERITLTPTAIADEIAGRLQS